MLQKNKMVNDSMYKYFIIVLLLFSVSVIYAEPAVPGTIITFYITDDNINTERKTAMTISTAGLIDFTINGVPISGPSEMVETGINTGIFQIQLTLPSSVNGRPLQNGDVVVMTYHQQADYSGNPTTVTQSRILTSVPTNPVSSTASNARIGRDFTLSINAPNYNLDSFHPDDIPLNMVEFRIGGLQTTLANSAFSVNTGALRETGSDTGVFQATFKIPKEVNGFPVELGSTMEFRFLDPTNPSSVFVRVGTLGVTLPSTGQSSIPQPVASTVVVRTSNPQGATVNYLSSPVLANLNDPSCYPHPGTFFSIGKTTVVCSGKDQAGNSVVKTFTVDVQLKQTPIPAWVKKLSGYWCSNKIDDAQMKSTIKYLVSYGIIHVDSSSGIVDNSKLCLWAGGQGSDNDASSVLYQLSR